MSNPNSGFQTALHLYRLGRRRDAKVQCRAILARQPDHWPALYLVGLIHLDAKRPDRALPALARAARSGAGPALTAMARALGALGRPEAALRAAQAAVATEPGHAAYLFNLGNLLQAQTRLDDAERAYRRAQHLRPALVDAHFNRATALLRAGRLPEGWAEYEWRWRRPGAPLHFMSEAPAWDGDSLAGRTLLLHSEQGLGDVLQFCRYLPEAERRAGSDGRIIVESPGPLLRLLRASFPTLTFVRKGRGKVDPTPTPPFQTQAALASLPGVVGTTLETIPARVPYLTVPAPPASAAPLPEIGPGPSVGLVWGSSATNPARDVPLRDLVRALRLPGVTLVSLQVGPHADALGASSEAAAAGVVDGGAWISAEDGADFTPTAALMHRLSLIVSVDTAPAHLAGALGLPLVILLPHLADWRWLVHRSDSPWYPTAHLIRQHAPGDWSQALDDLRAHVAARLA